MTRELDQWMAALAAEPADPRLAGLDAEIGNAIALRRREARAVRAMAPVRFATVGLALGIGLAVGSAAATAAINTSQPGGPFAAATRLAPSTLLEGAG